MSKKEIFNNAVTNIDDEYIADAMGGGVKKRRTLTAIIAVAVIAVIATASITTVAAVDLHRQRAEQKQAQKEAERIEYLKENEKNKTDTVDLSEIKTKTDLDAIKQAEEMKKEAQMALKNMKNPKEVVFENERYKEYRQLDQISLKDIDLSGIDAVEVCKVGSGETTVFTDKEIIEKVASVVHGIENGTLDNSGKEYAKYWLKMTRNGETVFGLFHDENGYFLCSCYVHYSVGDGAAVEYSVYKYTDEMTKNAVTNLFEELVK